MTGYSAVNDESGNKMLLRVQRAEQTRIAKHKKRGGEGAIADLIAPRLHPESLKLGRPFSAACDEKV